MKNCYVCENSKNNKIHVAREMMFGTRDEFEYLECGSCSTLQLTNIPDLSLYYPENYYSFETPKETFPGSFKERFFARSVAKYFGNRKNIIGKLLSKKTTWSSDFFSPSLTFINLNINLNSKILDFGCGNGSLLLRLQWFGFKQLTGIDAFIEKDIIYSENVKILKKDLAEIEPEFELIMAHHSLEHLTDPRKTLSEFYRLLKPNKFALIRIPLVSKAWEIYGVNWVQLDSPRHIFLFTENSFRKLAEEIGFKVEKVIYDSIDFQFYASEQYRQDIPLNDERAFNGNVEQSIFSESEIENWRSEAQKLNGENKGDQACFYLKRPIL